MKQIKIPEINEDLAYLCGVLAGDGYIKIRDSKRSRNRLVLGGNEIDEIEFYDAIIVDLFSSLFEIKIKPKSFGKNYYAISVCSKELNDFLVNRIGLVESPKINLRIPPIFYTDKKLLLNFISGVFDTDFSLVLRRGNYPVITGVSKCKAFMAEIADILEKEGFSVVRQFDYLIPDSRLRDGFNVINRIHINGHRMFLKWLDLIGTRQPKNLKKISLWEKRNETGRQSWKWVDLYRYEKSNVLLRIEPISLSE